ncbi:LysM peptidoglycan-binding domain-containing protein [Bacillaceae bacterium Marseille-Q3522]|nr:LysM peptidoglycan-binding domain-containing protein [Bacillaceae bacterium Marseille-Q3522]
MNKLWSKNGYVLILLFVSFVSTLILLGQHKSSDQYVKITVSEGDSLWSLSERYSNAHSYTPQDFIKWVEKNNGLSDDQIRPGDLLVIPVAKDQILEKQYASFSEGED